MSSALVPCNDDEKAKFLQGVFQIDFAAAPVVKITLHDEVVYQISKDALLKQRGSVFETMMKSEMQEQISHILAITDDDHIYTAQAVKLFFGALSFGSYVIQHSCFSLYDLMIVPLLVHYFCVDASIAEASTSALKKYKTDSTADIDNAVMVINVINASVSSLCMNGDNPPDSGAAKTLSYLTAHKEALLSRISSALLHETQSLDSYAFWSYLSIHDLSKIVDKLHKLSVVSTLKFTSETMLPPVISGHAVDILRSSDSQLRSNVAVHVQKSSYNTRILSFHFPANKIYNIQYAPSNSSIMQSTFHTTPVERVSISISNVAHTIHIQQYVLPTVYQCIVYYVNVNQLHDEQLSSDINLSTTLHAWRVLKMICKDDVDNYRLSNLLLKMASLELSNLESYVEHDFSTFSCADMMEFINACIDIWSERKIESKSFFLVRCILNWMISREKHPTQFREAIAMFKMAVTTLKPLLQGEINELWVDDVMPYLRTVQLSQVQAEIQLLCGILDGSV